MKKIVYILLSLLLVFFISGCSSRTPSKEIEELEIINRNDGAIYMFFNDDPLFASFNHYTVIHENHVFDFTNSFNLIILNLELHQEIVTVQLIDTLYHAMQSDSNVMIIFAGFTSYEIFRDTLFVFEGNTYDNHDRWIRYYTNFSGGGSYNLNINDENWKLYSAARSLFSKAILRHVEKL